MHPEPKWLEGNAALSSCACLCLHTPNSCNLPQGWAVPDAALRHAIRDGLADSLAPPYEAFWSKHQRAPYTDSHAKYERYSPADVQGLLSDLFERAEAGGGAQGQLLGRSPSSVTGGALLGRKLSSTMRRLTSSSQGTP